MPDIPAAIPDWVSNVGVVSLILFFGLGLARGWWYTAGQVTRTIEQYEKVAKLWEQVATERKEINLILTQVTEPIIQGNAAILKAVEELQREQDTRRPDRTRGRDDRSNR